MHKIFSTISILYTDDFYINVKNTTTLYTMCSVGSMWTFEETIDFSSKHRGFNLDFLDTHNDDRI